MAHVSVVVPCRAAVAMSTRHMLGSSCSRSRTPCTSYPPCMHHACAAGVTWGPCTCTCTWVHVHVGPCSRGSMRTWVHGHVGTCARGYVCTWVRVHVGPCSRGSVFTWVRVHVGPCTRGSVCTWVRAHVIPCARGYVCTCPSPPPLACWPLDPLPPVCACACSQPPPPLCVLQAGTQHTWFPPRRASSWSSPGLHRPQGRAQVGGEGGGG